MHNAQCACTNALSRKWAGRRRRWNEEIISGIVGSETFTASTVEVMDMVEELEADLQKETSSSNFHNDQPTFVSGCASIPVQLSLILGTGNVTLEKLPSESEITVVGVVEVSNPPIVIVIVADGTKSSPLTVTVDPVAPLVGEIVIVGLTLYGSALAQPNLLSK